MKQRIGILLPRSDMYSTLARDFMNGLKLFLNGKESLKGQIEFVIESVGTASDDTVIKTAEKQLLQEEVDLTLAFCGNSLLDQLVDLFTGYKKPLIHIDLGGNILKKRHVSPYVVHHSLNMAHAAAALGAYAAEHLGKKVALLSSFYDGGYQMAAGFDQGFASNGGNIAMQHVSPMAYKEQNMEEVLQAVENSGADVIFCLYSYKEGNHMWQALTNSSLNGKLPIVTTPIMTDESIVDKNYGVQKVQSVASWSFDDDTPAMTTFIKNHKDQYDEQPNIFGLLGYEIGLLLAHVLEAGNSVPKNLGEYMKSQVLHTPRGHIFFNAYNESQPKEFKLRNFEYNQITYHNLVVDTIENQKSETLNQHFEEQQFSGWINPYICT